MKIDAAEESSRGEEAGLGAALAPMAQRRADAEACANRALEVACALQNAQGGGGGGSGGEQ